MVRSMPWKLALIAVGALTSLALSAGRVAADDSEGIVRICDQVPGQASCQSGSCRNPGVSGCPSCQPGRPCQSHSGAGYRNCGVYGYYGNGNSGYCGYGCMRPCGHVHQFLDWFNPHGMCTHSPDYGYAPPGKLHTPHPQQVAYTKGFPDSWTGRQSAPGTGGPRAMSIYMPTDTTQLGYYYQAVPRWQARQGMVPPTPNPALWHRDLCQGMPQGCKTCRGQAASGSCPHCKGQAHGTGEQLRQEGVIDTQPQPAAPNPAPMIDPQPNPVDVDPAAPPAEPVPAAPLEKADNPNLQPIN